MDQMSCIGKIIVETLQPDYSVLKTEIEQFEYVSLYFPRFNIPRNYKILFATNETVVVQEIEMTWGETRFQTFGVKFEDWENHFRGFVSLGSSDFTLCDICWRDGFEMYKEDH